jgi:hypothetical protein
MTSGYPPHTGGDGGVGGDRRSDGGDVWAYQQGGPLALAHYQSTANWSAAAQLGYATAPAQASMQAPYVAASDYPASSAPSIAVAVAAGGGGAGPFTAHAGPSSQHNAHAHKTYSCSTCGKVFTRRDYLDRHELNRGCGRG